MPNVECMVWDIAPELITWPVTIRYYGVFFALTLLGGLYLWRWQMVRGGWRDDVAQNFFIYGVLGVVLGSRVGHCLFYNTDYYLSNPLQILYFWKGGLASHGATVGLIIALILYHRVYRIPLIELTDRLAIPAALAAAMVRMGNFFNSEIVGRATDVPWAVCFPRYDGAHMVPRHPSQLYEFFGGLWVMGLLFLVDRLSGKEKRPRGLMTGTFLVGYFTFRYLVEFAKEYQTLTPDMMITMGQILSIPFILAGLIILNYVWLKGGWPPGDPALARVPSAPPKPKQAKKTSKKKKR